MNTPTRIFVSVLCCCFPIHGKAQAAADAPFAGCYRIISQKWYPMNEDASPIPGRFRLWSEPVDTRSKDILRMRSIPASNNPAENLWIWQQKGDRLWLSWGMGFGGFRGTLKQSRAGEFVGKVKEWCDSHCEWKQRVATIRIQKMDCTE